MRRIHLECSRQKDQVEMNKYRTGKRIMVKGGKRKIGNWFLILKCISMILSARANRSSRRGGDNSVIPFDFIY